MKNETSAWVKEVVPNQTQANTLMEKLFALARPESLFSKPVVQGDHAVILASEVIGGMGYGFGGGGGSGPTEDGEMAEGGGGGGGGGGSLQARPVAAIALGPEGVRVEPIVDPTKIAIAFFTTMAAIFMVWRNVRQRAEELAP